MKLSIVLVVTLAVASRVAAQEHHEPAQAVKRATTAATTPPVTETPKQTVGVVPNASPTQVAAAIAEAMRNAEAAQANRQAARPTTPRPPAPRAAATSRPSSTTPQHRYEVRWITERMVVRWPTATSDHIQLTWPQPATVAQPAVPEGGDEFAER